MKRAISNDDSSDDELFSYNNKQKLHFSSPYELWKDDISIDSSTDSSDHNVDDDDIEIKPSGPCVENLKKIEHIPVLSPPPPPVSLPKNKKKTRKNNRSAKVDVQTITFLKNQLSETDTFHVDNDEICILNEVSALIKLKVRVHGVVEKYEVKKSDRLKFLIADIAKKEDVLPGHVSLNLGNACLDPEETINSLNLTVADILECVIHEDEVEKENTINIKIQSASKFFIYDIKLTETVERVLKDFCEKCVVDVPNVIFTFDGERINNFDTTFSELDTIDGDVIDADIHE